MGVRFTDNGRLGHSFNLGAVSGNINTQRWVGGFFFPLDFLNHWIGRG